VVLYLEVLLKTVIVILKIKKMIAPRQIGWSEKANLLWEISKQLDTTISLMCTGDCPTTTTTTTSAP
jgi:hypothetical protein